VESNKILFGGTQKWALVAIYQTIEAEIAPNLVAGFAPLSVPYLLMYAAQLAMCRRPWF